VFICYSIYAQQEQPEKSAIAEIRKLIETVHANPYQSFSAGSIDLPINDSQVSLSIYNLTDSLAQTNGYDNKYLANSIVYRYIKLYRKENTIKKWQRDFITKLIMMDFKYCCRYLINTIYPVEILSEDFFTPAIIEQCKELFEHPTYTREEAEIIATSFKPICSVSDTLGYSALKQKKDSLYAIRLQLQPYDRDLHGEEERLYEDARSMIRDAEKMGLNLEQYCDSINRQIYQNIINNYSGKELDRVSSLLSSFASNKVHVMAPLIEEYGTQYYYSDIDIQKMLARLNYKNYAQQSIKYYTHQIDSLSNILSSIDELIKYPTDLYLSTFVKTRNVFGSLCYIGTQESYFATAPLLLLKNHVKDDLQYEYPIGVYFYDEIYRSFKNVPLPECCYGTGEYGDFIHDPKDVYSPYTTLKCDEVENYLPIVYQWMLDNKGKYELKNPQND
jgi:hypothetical protein